MVVLATLGKSEDYVLHDSGFETSEIYLRFYCKKHTQKIIITIIIITIIIIIIIIIITAINNNNN